MIRGRGGFRGKTQSGGKLKKEMRTGNRRSRFTSAALRGILCGALLAVLGPLAPAQAANTASTTNADIDRSTTVSTGSAGVHTRDVGPMLFALSRDHQGVYALTPDGSWQPIGGPAGHIYAAIGRLYATNPKTGDIYKWNGQRNWARVGGPGEDFCIGREEGIPALFGLAPNGSGVFELKDGTSAWRKIGGRASSIYCASGSPLEGGNVYATNPDTGDVYGTTNHFTTWSKIGGPGRQFAANPQDFFGLNDKGVFLLGGNPVQVGGPAANIYAGGESNGTGPCVCQLLATDPKTHDVYLWYQHFKWYYIGGPGSDFVIDDQGGVYGLSPDGKGVYQWNGGLGPQDSKWKLVGPNGAAEIAAA